MQRLQQRLAQRFGAVVFAAVAALGLLLLEPALVARAAGDEPRANGCPPEMVRVHAYCVDRWELSLVDVASGEPLSPYYPPEPRLLRAAYDYWAVARFAVGDEAARQMPLPELAVRQRSGPYEPRAVSAKGAIPQGYLSYYSARGSCERSGKRLCTKDEWVAACRGEHGTKQPYGPIFVKGRCNVFRSLHPAQLLHGNSSLGHRDPRLNLIVENGTDPLLRPTGATSGCASVWGGDRIYDMVGNIDEWIELEPASPRGPISARRFDGGGAFVGGFYARSTNKGCDAEITSHAKSYYDYSTGARCCSDASGRGRDGS